MKNKYIYILTISSFMALQACKTTDISPVDRISQDVAFSTQDKINATVIGAYDGLQSAEFLSGRSLVYSDLLGNDVVDRNGYFTRVFTHTMISTDGFAAAEWTAGYAAIAKANRVIAGVKANMGSAGTKASSFIAEAEFIRAISLFTLVNHYAQPYNFTAGATHIGIPVLTKAATTSSPEDLVPRNTVTEVYTQIISDLKDAEINCLSTYGATYSDKVRATKLSASALLSRVYLYMGDYVNAKIEAEKVINSGTFALNATPSACFGPGNYQTKESIYSIPNNTNDNPNTNNALPMHYSPGGRADIIISPTFLNLPGFTAGDKRRSLTVVSGGLTYTTKYPDIAARADWAPLIRYPEMLLTAAEASVRISGVVDITSLARLNLVRNRSIDSNTLPYTVFTSATDFIDAVILERRIELAFEGHRMQDILRQKKDITGIYKDDLSGLQSDVKYGSDYSIFPIPDAEVKKDPKLIQNSGY